MSALGLSKQIDINFSFPAYLIPLSALSFCLIAAYRSDGSGRSPDPLKYVSPSPLKTTTAKLSQSEKQALAYPPDLLPGARDVQTPFGSIRVYEWGPEDGRKVLLVHGVSTPCLSLGLVAERMAKIGCRVMLFDLFGRGYSDDPSDLKHDARLYTTQILLALASSPLPWTGTNGFSIIGYSLGGGICASFTDSFPSLVQSLVLLCPSGIIRLSHIGWSSKFLYQSEGILPQSILHSLVRQRLWGGTVSGKPRKTAKTDATSAVAAEAGDDGDKSVIETNLYDNGSAKITSSVQWQIRNHVGFVPAFVSSIRNAPITDQHSTWQRIGKRLTAQKMQSASKEASDDGLSNGKVLLVLGKTDPLIIEKETRDDATAAFGPENVETVVVNGGHDIPVSNPAEVADTILKFWGETTGTS